MRTAVKEVIYRGSEETEEEARGAYGEDEYVYPVGGLRKVWEKIEGPDHKHNKYYRRPEVSVHVYLCVG